MNTLYASSVRTRAFELVRRTPSCKNAGQSNQVPVSMRIPRVNASTYNASLLDDGNALAARNTVSDLTGVRGVVLSKDGKSESVKVDLETSPRRSPSIGPQRHARC
jgi:hypothetical protein